MICTEEHIRAMIAKRADLVKQNPWTPHRDLLQAPHQQNVSLNLQPGAPTPPARAHQAPIPEAQGWIGVDLDGTLAEYHGWPADGSIGRPIPAMVRRVRRWLREGKDVRVVTARVSSDARDCDRVIQRELVALWCREHLGQKLPVTSEKNFTMLTLWDDRCRQVQKNTGRRLK